MLDAEAVQVRVWEFGTGRLNSKNKNRKVCNTHLLLKVKAAAEALKRLFAQSSHLQRSLSLFLSRSLQSAHLEYLVFKQEKDALPVGPVSSWRNKTLKGPKRRSSSPASQINTRTICYFTQVPESKSWTITFSTKRSGVCDGASLPPIQTGAFFILLPKIKQVSFSFNRPDQEIIPPIHQTKIKTTY